MQGHQGQGGSEQEGVVEEALPRGLYRVRCDGGKRVVASIGAHARRVTVKVIPGDRVLVEVSDIDPTRGRIKLLRK